MRVFLCIGCVVASAVDTQLWGSFTPPFDDAFEDLGQETCTDIGPFGDAEDGHCDNVRVPTLDCSWNRGSSVVAVVMPGGGFREMSIGRGGYQVQDWLVDEAGPGVSACVLKYRVPGPESLDYAEAEIADAQRAIKVARDYASTVLAFPVTVGVIGFSAGGFLAASTAIFNETYPAVDHIDDAQSAAPDFVMMIYPGLTTKVRNRTLVEQINADGLRIGTTVPVFLEQAKDDPFDADARNNDAMKVALVGQGIVVDQHIYETGSHGYGLCNVRRGDDVAALVKSDHPGIPAVPGWVHSPDACGWKIEAERFLAALSEDPAALGGSGGSNTAVIVGVIVILAMVLAVLFRVSSTKGDAKEEEKTETGSLVEMKAGRV